MLEKFLAALAATLVCAVLLFLLRQIMLTPVRSGKHTDQELRLIVHGAEPALENHVRGLLFLNDSGTLRCRILIFGRDLDERTRLVARALERDHHCVTFIETQ